MAKRGRPKGSGNKDPFKKLDETFRADVDAKPSEELKKIVTKVALDQVAIDIAHAADPDIERLKGELKTSQETYTEPTKQNKLKVKYLRHLLKERGEKDPTSLQDN